MSESKPFFVFPKWANYLLPLAVLGALGGAMIVPPMVGLGLSAETLNPGYQPDQPVPYSHEKHLALGLDCAYCHDTVFEAGHAAIPATETCVRCHAPAQDAAGNDASGILQESIKLAPVHASYKSGEPIKWVRVHDLADYVYFNHSAHVNRGIGCYSCHGRVDKMGAADMIGGSKSDDRVPGVYQVHNLSMAWCLDCHREPEKHLRPLEQVTSMTYHTTVEDQLETGRELKEAYEIRGAAYMQSCSTCHR